MARPTLLRKKPKPAIPERMMAPESGINCKQLGKKLESIAKEGGDYRPEILTLFKGELEAALDSARKHFEMGRLGGLEMARLIASIHDDIVTTLYDFATKHAVSSESPIDVERLTLCAVGGYGRGEMAPGSDLDLLFLTADKKDSPFAEQVTEYILYMLWDLGLKVGHSSRTPDQCLSLAKEDQTILTALLDLRYLRGDEALSRVLFARFRKNISRGKGRNYIASKLDERDARHDREGNSRYVIEPNVKEGKGGLRDLHVLYWIARFLDKDGKITDPQRASDYVEIGLFDKQAATRFVRAADFLWRARIHLHFTAGRPAETLSFDRQTVLARKMGYAAGPIEEAVEKFMREYFINAREVGALTRIACAKLEADNALRLPKGLDVLLPNSRKNMKEDGFIMDHGRLMFADPMKLKENPILIMRLFEIAGRRNLDIHPDAFSAIDFRRNLIDNDFRRDPEISQIFQNILIRTKAPGATLKIMNESGVLGRYILEFGGIVARTQFNMHHAYTVDEHTLGLVRYFHDLENGVLAEDNSLATDIATGLTESQRRCVYLACLLHDTGKGQGDQCIEGAQLARRACNRLGIEKAETERVAWLVRRHLDFSETAQRRDISDPKTIEEFGALIGSLKRLQMLFVLTVVDIRAVGPGIWNDWKGVLLRNLYLATADYLQGKTELAPASKAAAAKEQLKERLPGDMAERITPITQDLSDDYWLSFDMIDLVRHTGFFDNAIQAGDDISAQTRRDRPRDITELWVLARDREGLFADLCLAVSSCSATITGAQLSTGKNGRVMDVFYLQNAEGLAFGRKNERVLDMLRRRVTKAAKGDVSDLNIPTARASRRAGAIPVKPSVKFLDGATGETTIIEIVGRDRPGLLYALASCMKTHDVDVLSAHIEVLGTKAIDAFYVRSRDPKRYKDTARRKVMKADFLAILDPQKTASAA